MLFDAVGYESGVGIYNIFLKSFWGCITRKLLLRGRVGPSTWILFNLSILLQAYLFYVLRWHRSDSPFCLGALNSGVPCTDQIESLRSFSHICSQLDEGSSRRLLASFPSVLVPLSSDNQVLQLISSSTFLSFYLTIDFRHLNIFSFLDCSLLADNACYYYGFLSTIFRFETVVFSKCSWKFPWMFLYISVI